MASSKTKDEWLKLVEEFKTSGETQAEFCRKNDVNPKTFYTWVTKGEKQKAPGKKRTSRAKKSASSNNPKAVIRKRASPQKQGKQNIQIDDAYGTLNVVLPNGTEISYKCSSKEALIEAIKTVASL